MKKDAHGLPPDIRFVMLKIKVRERERERERESGFRDYIWSSHTCRMYLPMVRGSPRGLLFFGHLNKFTVTVTVTVTVPHPRSRVVARSLTIFFRATD